MSQDGIVVPVGPNRSVITWYIDRPRQSTGLTLEFGSRAEVLKGIQVLFSEVFWSMVPLRGTVNASFLYLQQGTLARPALLQTLPQSACKWHNNNNCYRDHQCTALLFSSCRHYVMIDRHTRWIIVDSLVLKPFNCSLGTLGPLHLQGSARDRSRDKTFSNKNLWSVQQPGVPFVTESGLSSPCISLPTFANEVDWPLAVDFCLLLWR